jgi:hypothetical protein
MPDVQNDSWPPLRDDDPHGDEGEFTTEASITCPWCGAENLIAIDPGGGVDQDYIEDCQLCCRPCRLQVTFDAIGSPQIEVSIDQ